MNRKLIYLLVFVLVTFHGYSQSTNIEILMNFDDVKTRLCFDDANEVSFNMVAVWDSHFITIVSDPVDANNNVIRWEKDNSVQTHGGMAFEKREGKFDVKDWKSISYRIRCSQPFNSSVLRLKNNHVITFDNRVIITGEADRWYKVVHVFERDAQFVNILDGFQLMPADGENVQAVFLIDDIRLER